MGVPEIRLFHRLCPAGPNCRFRVTLRTANKRYLPLKRSFWELKL